MTANQNPNTIEITADTQNLIDEVDNSLIELSKFRPFNDEINQKITKEFIPDRVTASLNIEGISVSKRQTLVMMDLMSLSANSTREQREILNALKADEFVFDSATEDEPISPMMIREINSLVQDQIMPEAGAFREENVEISGAKFSPPDFLSIPSLISDMTDIYANTKNLHPIIRAAWLHASFTYIHPFKDGNGRTGRLIQDFSLISDGLYPTGIPSNLRDKYYDALEAADSGNWNNIIQMISQEELKIIARVQAIVSEAEIRDSWIDILSKKASQSKAGTLHKQYTVWKQRVEIFCDSLVSTCDDINKSSDVIQIKSDRYDVIDFDDWKALSDRNARIANNWALKQSWLIDGDEIYKTIIHFKQHRFRPDDIYDTEELRGTVSMYITGGNPKKETRFNFGKFSDEDIKLREVFFLNGKLNASMFNGKKDDDDETWEQEEYETSFPIVRSLIEDIVIKKMGIS